MLNKTIRTCMNISLWVDSFTRTVGSHSRILNLVSLESLGPSVHRLSLGVPVSVPVTKTHFWNLLSCPGLGIVSHEYLFRLPYKGKDEGYRETGLCFSPHPAIPRSLGSRSDKELRCNI